MRIQIVSGAFDGVRLALVLQANALLGVYAQKDDARPWLHDQYGVKVMRYAPAQRAFFVDFGAGLQGFLPEPDVARWAAGDMIAITVERPATRDKHIRCSFAGAANATGLIARGPDVVAQAAAAFPDAVAADDPHLFDDHVTLVTALLAREVTIREGVTLLIDEAGALTAIDVNNAAPGLLPLAVNELAAVEATRQIKLRNLGGQMVIDFLRMRSVDQRRVLDGKMHELMAGDEVILHGFTRMGLYELARKRTGLSLEQVFSL